MMSVETQKNTIETVEFTLPFQGSEPRISQAVHFNVSYCPPEKWTGLLLESPLTSEKEYVRCAKRGYAYFLFLNVGDHKRYKVRGEYDDHDFFALNKQLSLSSLLMDASYQLICDPNGKLASITENGDIDVSEVDGFENTVFQV